MNTGQYNLCFLLCIFFNETAGGYQCIMKDKDPKSKKFDAANPVSATPGPVTWQEDSGWFQYLQQDPLAAAV